MYNHSEVIAALTGRVGFRQPTQADIADIFDTANAASESGLYFDDFHAIVTAERLFNVVNNDPAVSNEDFNTQVVELKNSCIAKVLDAIFGVSDIIEQDLEFTAGTQQPVVIPNSGQFVGRQIRVASSLSRAVRIDAIQLLFDGEATFKLYLFNSLKKAPIKELEVTSDADNQVIIIPEAWVMKSGLFFIGYFQDDLGSVKAYDEQPCQRTCGRLYGSCGIETVRIANEIDFRRYQTGISNRTYGINIRFASVKDFTDVILSNKTAFDKAIGLQMAAVVVEKIMNNSRSNGDQRISEAQAARLYNDLNVEMSTPELPVSFGLKKQLRRELDRVRESFIPKKKPSVTPIQNECYTPRPRR